MSLVQKKQASKLPAERVKKQRKLKKNVKRTDIFSQLCESPNIYRTPQTLGKAVARIKKKLPTSPRKKIAVIEKLATDTGLLIKKKSNSANALDENVKNSVADFYVRDDIYQDKLLVERILL
ncbi:hypothetical protein JTE90_018174 [Oedothorax gibbosus]|uniref:Uncharacterized protein n=1 Tax=Oedothorax gibbosus TaxID=931172 RepID=A0AAV6U8Q3_9ARAC|nr:hypothetical protein JTE90_018174 [Oedothorax gibbosus]